MEKDVLNQQQESMHFIQSYDFMNENGRFVLVSKLALENEIIRGVIQAYQG